MKVVLFALQGPLKRIGFTIIVCLLGISTVELFVLELQAAFHAFEIACQNLSYIPC